MNFRDLLNIFEQGATTPATPPAYKGSQDAQAIARASGVKNVNVIKPGQQLTLPGGGSYTVKAGDTMDKIARQNPAAAPAAAGTASPAAVAPTISDRAADPNVAGVAKAAPAIEPAAPAAIVRPNTTLFGGRADAPKSPFAGPQEIIKPSTAIGAPNSVEPTNAPVNAGPIGARTADFVKQSAAKPAGGGPTVTTGPAATAPPMSNVDAAVKAASAAPAGGGPTVTTNPSQPPPSMDLSPKDQSTLGNLPAGPGQVGTNTGGTFMSRSGPVQDGSNIKRTAGGFTLPEEAELEEDDSLSELMRLSGRPMQEKAPPGAKAERQVKHIKAGYTKDGKLTDKEKSIAYATAWKQHNKSKVSESVMLEAGSALEHIIKKFKHETKNFVSGQDLDSDLYDALYDYYSDNGEMPYGVAKARDGDPFTWVSDKFADELQMHGYSRQSDMLGGHDNALTELARLAGLSESQVSECGDMGSMEQHDSMSVSTNMSSDGTKSVNISAQGDKADSLLQMLKMAGMRPYDDHEHMGMTEPEVIMISSEPQHDDMMDEEMMDEEYANEPAEEYHSIDSILRQGNDLNREKKQYAQSPKLGDNPMAESMLDADLEAMLESILVREYTDVLSQEKGGVKGATMAPPDSEFAPGDKRNLAPAAGSKMPAAPKTQTELNWDARVKADKGGVLPAERGGVKGATMAPADSQYAPGDRRNLRK